jgi:hypothetical protein
MTQLIRLTLLIILFSNAVHARGGQAAFEETEDKYTQFNKGIVMDRHMDNKDADTIIEKGKQYFNTSKTKRPNITISKRATIRNGRKRETQLSQSQNHVESQKTRTGQRSFYQMSIRVKRTTNTTHYANKQNNPPQYQ